LAINSSLQGQNKKKEIKKMTNHYSNPSDLFIGERMAIQVIYLLVNAWETIFSSRIIKYFLINDLTW
jgi:hypothetical protein